MGNLTLSESSSHSFFNSPHRVLDQNRPDLIIELREERKRGSKRIQAELLHHHAIRLATATNWKVLHSYARAPLVRKRPPKSPRRYSRPLLSDRVQVDMMKVRPGCFQYIAIDDCTRLRVSPRRTASTTVHFLKQHMVGEFPFPIQQVQTDRGGEFWGMGVSKGPTKRLHEVPA